MSSYDEDPFDIKEQLEYFSNFFTVFNAQAMNLVKPIVKKIIFLKIFAARTTTNSRYRHSLVYDALSALHCIYCNQERYFYFSNRSFIENLARVCQNISDNNIISITKTLQGLQTILDKQNVFSQDLFSDLRTRYSQYCSFVHNNIESGINVRLNFTGIAEPDKFTPKEIENNLKQLDKLLEIAVSSLYITHKREITSKFGIAFEEIRKMLPPKLSNLYLS